MRSNCRHECCINLVFIDGKITEVGTFQELIQAQKHFAEFLEDFLMNKVKQCKQTQDEGDSEEMEELLKDLQVLNPEQRKHLEGFSGTGQQHADSILTIASSIKHISSLDNLPAEQQDGTTEQDVAAKKIDSNLIKIEIGEKADGIALSAQTANKPATASNDERSKLIEKEGVEVGKVKFAVYLLYLHAIGYGTTAIFVSIYIFSSVLGVSSNLWLANWSDHANKGNITAVDENDTNWRLGIYATLGLGQAAMVCTGSITMAYGMVFASRKLHEGILRNIMHLPMAFFDITPLGRIVNRFGKDIVTVDIEIPKSIDDLLDDCQILVAILILIVFIYPHSFWFFITCAFFNFFILV
ncbi:unnamed protein product [Wuchereria bancrofti]|uniref:ABC transmembrane type-1 domain-containing protein n=1 Tax=Wuchereria bancrofti TaxID=6293 RepID=A0A3P7F2X1_WUCBA|nr:unnamed protein product [Wuchereria bancrofti]